MESIHETRHVIVLHKILILNISYCKAQTNDLFVLIILSKRRRNLQPKHCISFNNYDKNKYITEVDFIKHNI